MRRALFKLLPLPTGARAFPGAQYQAGIMPALLHLARHPAAFYSKSFSV